MFPGTTEDPLEIKLEESCLTIEDLPHICKVCFRKENTHCLDDIFIENMPLSKVFVQLTSIEINTNSANKICNDCQSKLVQVYTFIEQIRQHDLILKIIIASESAVFVTNSENSENCDDSKCLIKEGNDEKSTKINCSENKKCKTKINWKKIQSIKPSKKRRLRPRKEGDEEVYECDVCGKKFSLRYNLMRHKDVHDGLRFKCSLCDRAFTRKSSRDDHVRTHTGEKPYVCARCGLRFSSATGHHQHTRQHTNSNLTKIVCEICHKQFSSRSALGTHILRHMEEKSVLCNVCGKRFITKGALDIHMKVHTGEKPYSCDICKKTFAQPSALGTHKLIHEGIRSHKCEICDKTFVQSAHLKAHIRTHTHEKPYTCNFCQKSFTQNSYLRVHLRIHTGETPYCCNVCDKKCYSSGQLRKHKLAHLKCKNEDGDSKTE